MLRTYNEMFINGALPLGCITSLSPLHWVSLKNNIENTQTASPSVVFIATHLFVMHQCRTCGTSSQRRRRGAYFRRDGGTRSIPSCARTNWSQSSLRCGVCRHVWNSLCIRSEYKFCQIWFRNHSANKEVGLINKASLAVIIDKTNIQTCYFGCMRM